MTNDRVFNDNIDKLRDPDRIERYQPAEIIDACLIAAPAKTVLDIGTGTGLFAEFFTKRKCEVTGIDLNEQMLEAARMHVPGAVFEKAKAESLPFDDDSFDLVFFGCSLHEVDDLVESLTQARRVAKQAVIALDFEYRDQDFGPPLHHRIPMEKLKSACQKAGFADLTVQPISQMALFIFQCESV